MTRVVVHVSQDHADQLDDVLGLVTGTLVDDYHLPGGVVASTLDLVLDELDKGTGGELTAASEQ